MDLRYPIGNYEPQPYNEELKQRWLYDIKYLPTDLEIAIQTLDSFQFDTPYREGGWSVKQVVHHVADSHMNAYMRFKLGLTEDNPVIKTYDEKKWAILADIDSIPVNVSVTLLHALHQRWYASLSELSDEQWQRTIFHPEQKKAITLWHLLGMYAWHGKHHVAHITELIERNNWK